MPHLGNHDQNAREGDRFRKQVAQRLTAVVLLLVVLLAGQHADGQIWCVWREVFGEWREAALDVARERVERHDDHKLAHHRPEQLREQEGHGLARAGAGDGKHGFALNRPPLQRLELVLVQARAWWQQLMFLSPAHMQAKESDTRVDAQHHAHQC